MKVNSTEVNLPELSLKFGGRGEFPAGGISRDKPPESTGAPSATSLKNDRRALDDLMRKTAELFSAFDRELRYEILEEAGVVQIHVIDVRDGHVVRKIPADEMIAFIEFIREQASDRLDIRI
ncbi:MAG: flagellar protein FlaG [Synergistaceae bacterium]|jgi:uncharacterized FlaG/YvyC family protein|nr:flagellar protein FlaG [Synergistaceae bacterium]